MTASIWLRRAGIVLLALALLAFVGYLIVFANLAFTLFRFPFDYDQGEGFELYDTLLYSQGQSPYRDSSVFPFYTSIYPPVFHWLTVPLVWVFGAQLWTGRLVGFVAALVAAAAIGWAVQRETRAGPIAVLSGLAFVASNYVYHIGALFRQHMTMVMFETLAIVVLSGIDRQPSPRPRTIVLGLSLLLAAGFTKPLALATALAALAFLFLRRPRSAVMYAAGAALVAGALFFGINWATDGYWFTGIVQANVNEYSTDQALSLYRQWAGLHAVLIAVAVGRSIYETYVTRLSAFAVWFVFAALNGASAGKFGAGESYFVTAVAAACLLSGIALGRLWRWAPRLPIAGGLLALAIPAAYLVQARLVLHLPTRGPVFEPLARALGVPADEPYFDSQGYTQLGRPPDAADVAAGWRIAGYIARTDKPALSEEAGFPLAVGREVVSNPFPQLMLYRSGHLDPREFARAIEAQQFGVVVLRAQFYPPPILEAIGRAYRPEAEIKMNDFTYRILLPRDR